MQPISAVEEPEEEEKVVEPEDGMGVREVCANGLRMKTTLVEAKLDEGNIQEAESSLREGLSLNFEVRYRVTLFIALLI